MRYIPHLTLSPTFSNLHTSPCTHACQHSLHTQSQRGRRTYLFIDSAYLRYFHRACPSKNAMTNKAAKGSSSPIRTQRLVELDLVSPSRRNKVGRLSDARRPNCFVFFIPFLR